MLGTVWILVTKVRQQPLGSLGNMVDNMMTRHAWDIAYFFRELMTSPACARWVRVLEKLCQTLLVTC